MKSVMKKFVISASGFVFFLLIVLELFFRISRLACDLPIFEYFPDDSLILSKPGTEGYFTQGGNAEVFSHFKINKQGWNSIVDYDIVTDGTIAIVGDSYIEGRYVNVEESLGRRVEKLYPRVIVHEYGVAGANFFDYNNVCRKLLSRGYKSIYVCIGPRDLFAERPSYTQQNGYKQRPIQRLYKHSALARYLVLNLKITEIVTGKRGLRKQEGPGPNIKEINKKFEEFGMPGIIYMYESPVLDSLTTGQFMLKIVHEKLPEDYGFNGHWNTNGVDNVAKTVAEDLRRNPRVTN